MPLGAESMVLFAQSGLTGPGGTITFNFPAGMFQNIPVCAISLGALGGNVMEGRLTAVSKTQATVTVRASAFLTVLGVGVLGTANAVANVPVHLVAIEPESYV